MNMKLPVTNVLGGIFTLQAESFVMETERLLVLRTPCDPGIASNIRGIAILPAALCAEIGSLRQRLKPHEWLLMHTSI